MDSIVREKISSGLKGNKNRVGKVHSSQTKTKIRLHNKGYFWFNNGCEEVKAKECPEGFEKGRLKRYFRWYSNGKENAFTEINLCIHEEWYLGRCGLKKDRQWFNNGKRNFLLVEPPIEQLKAGKMFYGMVKGPQKKSQALLKAEIAKRKVENPQKEMGRIFGEPVKLEKTLLEQNQERVEAEEKALKETPKVEKKYADESEFGDYSDEKIREVTQKQGGSLSEDQLRKVMANRKFNESKYEALLANFHFG